jgi:clan AA aspartic protease
MEVFMGAVRVNVKLTNGVDEGLMRMGQLRPEDVRSYEGDALVDTGSVETIIPEYVMRQLGLPTSGQVNVRDADGRGEVVQKTGPITVRLLNRDTIGEAYVLGEEILIGQTILESMDLHVDCYNQKLIPNPAHPDRPTFRV